jgi:hypothetical protein
MQFTDDQIMAYLEFFRILGNIQRRKMLAEQAHIEKQSPPAKTDPVPPKHHDLIPISGRQQR